MTNFDDPQPELKPFGKTWPTLRVLFRHQRNRRDLFQRQNLLGDNGSADLSFFMGNAHSRGRGAPRDPEQAFLWWRDAAERGHVQAMIALGTSLIIGHGTPKDRDQARYWLKRAGREGDKTARSMLAKAYAEMRRNLRGWK
ncbi:MAG: sel1 repeat family protein [Elusimicrobia bacterium]|jgi:TPR repeat protein|nr:sel1 repeat family protein [Elusimicrobiota bacterium]